MPLLLLAASVPDRPSVISASWAHAPRASGSWFRQPDRPCALPRPGTAPPRCSGCDGLPKRHAPASAASGCQHAVRWGPTGCWRRAWLGAWRRTALLRAPRFQVVPVAGVVLARLHAAAFLVAGEHAVVVPLTRSNSRKLLDLPRGLYRHRRLRSRGHGGLGGDAVAGPSLPRAPVCAGRLRVHLRPWRARSRARARHHRHRHQPPADRHSHELRVAREGSEPQRDDTRGLIVGRLLRPQRLTRPWRSVSICRIHDQRS